MADPGEISWRTQPNGMLFAPPYYHDGILTDFAFGPDKTCRLGIAPVGGAQRTEIVVAGVSQFGIRDLTTSEIVIDIWIYRLDALPDAVRNPEHEVWRALFANIGEAAKECATRLMAAGRDDVLLHVTCAMDGELAVLGRSIRTFMVA
jgi:hypothetical protein